MIIKRSLLEEIKAHLRQKEITMIAGARQVGKTTIMQIMQDELLTAGELTLFLNLDLEEDKQFFSSQLRLLAKIELELGKNRGYIFIDEVQRLQNAGLFLKGLYDRNLGYKFIVSGSGSLELKDNIQESLAGRKQIFEVAPVSFAEFVNLKTGYNYEDRLVSFLETDDFKARLFLEEYLNFGGYPRVLVADTVKEKRMVIDEIYRSYIDRDISAFLKVTKLESYSQLIRALAAQTGNMTNYSELSNTLGISLPTVKNYLWYAEKTFFVQKVAPYFRNKRKEITKSPVYYFNDPGMRNFVTGLFGNLDTPVDFSFPFENLVLNIIKEKLRFSGAEVFYWRTKDGAEVDFVIDYGSRQLPVEVKYRNLKKPALSRSFQGFIKRYRPKKALIVNLSLDATVNIEETTVHFIPYYRLSDFLI